MASELRVNQITSQTGLGTVTFDAAGGVTFAASPLFSVTGSIGIGTAIPRSRFHIYSPVTRPFEVWAGTAGTAFGIDSSGRVLTPFQPAFCVSRQDGASATSSHAVPQFTTTFFNIGNCFSLSTQRFTAPVSGTYLFTGHVIPTGLAQNTAFELWIAVNSSTVSTARRFLDRGKKTEADSNTFSVGGSITIYLDTNDWVQLTTTTASYSDETNSKFSGFLVG